MSLTPNEKAPLKKAPPQEVINAKQVASWGEIGDSFETLGKVGLALAIGMSAAGLFCRLADQGKVRVPALSDLVLNRADQPSANGTGAPS